MRGFTAGEAARRMADVIGRAVDVIVNDGRPPIDVIERYATEHKEPLPIGELPAGCEVVVGNSGRRASRDTTGGGWHTPCGGSARGTTPRVGSGNAGQSFAGHGGVALRFAAWRAGVARSVARLRRSVSMRRTWMAGLAAVIIVIGLVPVRAAGPGTDADLRQPRREGEGLRRRREANVGLRRGGLPGREEQRAVAVGAGRRGIHHPEGRGGNAQAALVAWGTGAPVEMGSWASSTRCPGLSPDALPSKKPSSNAPGHGCGHNLFGTASMAAAIAIKDWLVASKRPGTIRFYGTPAEEGGSGKVYMVRGPFDDVDSVIAWHPGDRNQVSADTSLANITGKFHGSAASRRTPLVPRSGDGRRSTASSR